MPIQESFARREVALINKILEKRAGIDDRTGKGLATEAVIETELLIPFLPPGFGCGKGAIVSAEAPHRQSPAIDRVIFDKAAAPPFLSDEAHSIFPIEAVAGMVEITMHLDSRKLREDVERMVRGRQMKTRRYLAPVPGSTTKVFPVDIRDAISARSYIVGLPADPNWSAKTIAQTLRDIQVELGPPTHVHGLYVIGIGCFFTLAVEENEQMYRVGAWLGEDRLFRFVDSFRRAFDRWDRLQPGWSVDWGCYIASESCMLAE